MCFYKTHSERFYGIDISQLAKGGFGELGAEQI